FASSGQREAGNVGFLGGGRSQSRKLEPSPVFRVSVASTGLSCVVRSTINWRPGTSGVAGANKSDVAEIDGLAQGSEWIARGDKFVGDVAAEVGGGDTAHDAVPLDFLGGVEFVAAGNAAGMEVGDPIDVFLDGADEVTFHDLHVIDVEEELDARRVDGLDDLHTPSGVVAHVVVVVDLTVEKLQADGDPVVLGDFFDA